MAFINDYIFPTDIARNAAVDLIWAGDLADTDGGFEEANQPWSQPVKVFNVGYGMKSIEDVEEVMAALHATQGHVNRFRFLDFTDWKSCPLGDVISYDDQIILASAVGGETEIQLSKGYLAGSTELRKNITRPFGAVLVGKNSVALSNPADFTVDDETGVVTLTTALTLGDQITAGFYYHLPARFEKGKYRFSMQDVRNGSVTLMVHEVKE